MILALPGNLSNCLICVPEKFQVTSTTEIFNVHMRQLLSKVSSKCKGANVYNSKSTLACFEHK